MMRYTMSQLLRLSVVAGSVFLGGTVAASAGFLSGDGDFGAQTLDSSSMSMPWYGTTGIASGHVISGAAQSPFVNLFAPNAKGVQHDGSIGIYAGYYINGTTYIPAAATGAVYLNVDFRNTTNVSGQDACYTIRVAADADGAKATAALFIGKDGVYAQSSTGYGDSLLTPEVGVWYNAQLTLDLSTNMYSGVITKQGGAQTVISSRGFISESYINTIFMNCGGPVAPFPVWPAAIPNFDIDNYALLDTPIPPVPEPGTLALLATALAVCAWRKRK